MTAVPAKKIGVVIPAFNVSRQIAGVIRTVPAFVDRIVVVDDASTDGTPEAAAACGDPRVTVVKHERNLGVGGAMLTGFAKSLELGQDIFVKMDGDGQMRPEYLAALVAPLLAGRADYAKGNRFTDFRSLERMPAVRRIGNGLLSFFVKMVAGYWHIFDVTNGYLAVNAETWKRLDWSRISKGYFFEISMLIELNVAAARVSDVEMPSVYGDEKSGLRPGRVAVAFPLLLMRGLMSRFYRRYIIRDFNIVSICVLSGAPLFVAGVSYGLSLWLCPPHPGMPTPAGTVMIAALPIIIGFQLLLTALVLDVVLEPGQDRRA